MTISKDKLYNPNMSQAKKNKKLKNNIKLYDEIRFTPTSNIKGAMKFDINLPDGMTEEEFIKNSYLSYTITSKGNNPHPPLSIADLISHIEIKH